MRITRREHVGELNVEVGNGRLQLRHLSRERGILGGEFAGGFEVAAGRLTLAVDARDRGELGEPLPNPTSVGRVSVQLRVGQLTFEVGMFGQHDVDGVSLNAVRHGAVLPPSRI